ncbi:Bul1 N terminus family protein [Candida albicans]|uniref:Bul1 N terminus family protein n=1 Tax=Candida albicans TaxID=5476 RepID=A0A8H6BYG6_CANAX|nr:Bul1 N terminus family protein [Candida albicans]
MSPDNEPQPPNEDELLNNILPSYHMFQSTVSKNLTPTNENYSIDPPTYEMTPITSETPSLLTFSRMQSPVDERLETDNYFPQSDNDSVTYNQESEDMWKNSILANADKLPNLTHKKNSMSECLQIDIQVTEKVCQSGIKPIFMDPSNREFKQGDYLHGYVTIRNTSDQPIPFDMVYVVFEGTFTTLDTSSGTISTEMPALRFKFLTMLDLFASWSYANIDRLITDNGDPHDWCNGETDPYDNTLLSIDVKRLFQPNVTYKRFFTFKIPDKLLDSTCDQYNLPTHTEIPPTLGIDRNSFPPSFLLANQHLIVKDLSFSDSCLAYRIDARVIGKASDYKYKVDKDHNTSRPNLSPMMSNDSVKLRQLYDVADDTFKTNLRSGKSMRDEDYYQCLIPFKKKSITGSSKYLGIISLSTIKEHYKIRYTPPTRFGKAPPPNDTELLIPLELNYFTESSTPLKNLPEIKAIDVEVVALSIRSKKHPIPIEFTTDMLFAEKEIDIKKSQPANFNSLVVARFSNYLNEFHKLIKGVGNEALRLETKLYQDVKCLASLKTKYINLPISNLVFETTSQNGIGTTTEVKSLQWQEEQSEKGKLFTKKFAVRMNLNNCSSKSNDNSSKGLDRITLVPSFQTCFASRLYYIKMTVRLNHGDSLLVNVPLNIHRY